MSTVRQRLFVCLIAIVMVFGVVVSAAPNIAYAESGELNYDKTKRSALRCEGLSV